MKIAVVGAGVFGCVAAIDLAGEGHDVELFDRHPELLWGASRSCQGRLHRGYHYPRSAETAREAEDSFHHFADRFPEVVQTHYRHHYLIAATDSLTTPGEWAEHCRVLRLPFRSETSPMVNAQTVQACFGVPEAIIDVRALRARLRTDLHRANVSLFMGESVPLGDRGWYGYDRVVDCTYGAFGWLPLRYELCETAFVQLGRHYSGQSFVVMDGPFISLDPVPGSAMHMVYDVDRSVHHVTDDPADIPQAYTNLINRGIQYAPMTRVDGMLFNARRFLNGVGMPLYGGSMFTVRAVLPDMETTDARPTLVEDHEQVIRVLSGKIGTSVVAARQIVNVVAGVGARS